MRSWTQIVVVGLGGEMLSVRRRVTISALNTLPALTRRATARSELLREQLCCLTLPWMGGARVVVMIVAVAVVMLTGLTGEREDVASRLGRRSGGHG